MTKPNGRTEVFVDTSGWKCYFDASQPFHEDAKLLYRLLILEGRKLITTNYVVAELVAVLTSPLRIPRSKIVAFVEAIKSSPHIEIVHVDKELDDEARELLKRHQDDLWSTAQVL